MYGNTEIIQEISDKVGWTQDGCFALLPRSGLLELGAKYVIAVNVNFKAMESDHYDNMINIATHLSALWAAKNAREEEKLADVAIDVNAKGIAIYDLSKAQELLRRGRKATKEKLPQITALIVR